MCLSSVSGNPLDPISLLRASSPQTILAIWIVCASALLFATDAFAAGAQEIRQIGDGAIYSCE